MRQAIPHITVVLGIRPDVIRASRVLELLDERAAAGEIQHTFIWSGQHYSDNLKDVFFRELGVRRPDLELDAGGTTDAELVGDVITKLGAALAELRPDVAVFLGDTNTVVGSIAAAQLNIPIVHIEGCMRSYDWRMPEEKYRTITDHLSDLVYCYFDEYAAQGVREGLNPRNLVVVGNVIVDVLQRHYLDKRTLFDVTDEFFTSRGLVRGQYYMATCHRRENIESAHPLTMVMHLFAGLDAPVYFAAGYRTQRMLGQHAIKVPDNVIVVDPIGYTEMLTLMVNSLGVVTDSGTVVEETAVLGVPSVQMRHSTERPQVYDCKSSVKFDPGDASDADVAIAVRKMQLLHRTSWDHNLGDGRASERIVDDLIGRLQAGWRGGHERADSHLPTGRSYQSDGLVEDSG